MLCGNIVKEDFTHTNKSFYFIYYQMKKIINVIFMCIELVTNAKTIRERLLMVMT